VEERVKQLSLPFVSTSQSIRGTIPISSLFTPPLTIYITPASDQTTIYMELIAAIRAKYAGGGLDVPTGQNTSHQPYHRKSELVWEFVQMDKVHDKQRDIYRLKCIVLAEAGVSHVCGEAAGGLEFGNCEELDLSGNGISSWEQVASILRLFPVVKTLRLRYFSFLSIGA